MKPVLFHAAVEAELDDAIALYEPRCAGSAFLSNPKWSTSSI